LTLASAVLILLAANIVLVHVAAQEEQALRITGNFSAQKAVAPDAQLELQMSRSLKPKEGRLAVLVGETDVTALCVKTENRVTYKPQIPLPLGETSVIIYLVSEENRWTEVARLPLVVEEPKPIQPQTKEKESAAASSLSPPAPPAQAKQKKPNPFQFIPSVSVNVKAQSVVLFFPQSSRPERINFTDVSMQATLQGNYSQTDLKIQNQFDLAGSTFQNEALRFGDLGRNAPQVDLSSYLMQYQFHNLKLRVGHISFGSSRQLINNFSSRGISLTVPITKRFDLSGAVMNGTSVVGFDNFFGVSRVKHQIISGALGIELLTKRPGGLRIEIGVLEGSLLPVSSFNQGSVTDAEKDFGGSVRILGSDKSQRLRFDAGFARSHFTNPADPLLYQGRNVVAVRPVSKNARYLDLSYDLLRNYKLIKSRPLNLSLAYRHERVDPLYRSVAASTQADRQNNQLAINGSFGDITFSADDTRAHDDLAGIRSILKTLTRHNAFTLSLSSASLFNQAKPSRWLPRLSLGFDRTHQFAAFVPVGGDFTSLSQIPNQVSTVENFSADWQLSSRLRFGYRFNYSFQDNRQFLRERADILNEVNGVTLGFSPTKRLDLNFDLNAERASNFEQNAISTNLRVGTNLTWRMTKTMVWALNASTTGAGDRARTNHRRDADFDIQYAWRFLSKEGKNRFKKVQGQFFIRYANRYGLARDNIFGFVTLTKFQVFNAGLNFTFF
ncbi:MAG: hypothetical protein M3362_23655, partial [Acidobacteriota bacterium]|nr:hypothetical protein [Acidobacteriota bacterium]